MKSSIGILNGAMPATKGAVKRKLSSKRSKSVSDLVIDLQPQKDTEKVDADDTIVDRFTVDTSTSDESTPRTPEAEGCDKEKQKGKGIGRFRKGLKNLFKRKKVKKETKDQVEEINIVQEDDTDYELQWSKRVSRAASFGNAALLAASLKLSDDLKPPDGTAVRALRRADDAHDDIPVISDAEVEDL